MEGLHFLLNDPEEDNPEEKEEEPHIFNHLSFLEKIDYGSIITDELMREEQWRRRVLADELKNLLFLDLDEQERNRRIHELAQADDIEKSPIWSRLPKDIVQMLKIKMEKNKLKPKDPISPKPAIKQHATELEGWETQVREEAKKNKEKDEKEDQVKQEFLQWKTKLRSDIDQSLQSFESCIHDHKHSRASIAQDTKKNNFSKPEFHLDMAEEMQSLEMELSLMRKNHTRQFRDLMAGNQHKEQIQRSQMQIRQTLSAEMTPSLLPKRPLRSHKNSSVDEKYYSFRDPLSPDEQYLSLEDTQSIQSPLSPDDRSFHSLDDRSPSLDDRTFFSPENSSLRDSSLDDRAFFSPENSSLTSSLEMRNSIGIPQSQDARNQDMRSPNALSPNAPSQDDRSFYSFDDTQSMRDPRSPSDDRNFFSFEDSPSMYDGASEIRSPSDRSFYDAKSLQTASHTPSPRAKTLGDSQFLSPPPNNDDEPWTDQTDQTDDEENYWSLSEEEESRGSRSLSSSMRIRQGSFKKDEQSASESSSPSSPAEVLRYSDLTSPRTIHNQFT